MAKARTSGGVRGFPAGAKGPNPVGGFGRGNPMSRGGPNKASVALANSRGPRKGSAAAARNRGHVGKGGGGSTDSEKK